MAHIMRIDEMKRAEREMLEEKFNEWKSAFDGYMLEMIEELQSAYLDELGLSISVNSDYVFNGGKNRWLAAYERRSRKIRSGIVSIAINYPLFYGEMAKRNIDEDDFNIEAQARITIGHEIGHGLVDYIKNLKLDADALSKMPNVKCVVDCNGRKEEDLVEEFGEYQFSDATDVYDSVLNDAMEELKSTK